MVPSEEQYQLLIARLIAEDNLEELRRIFELDSPHLAVSAFTTPFGTVIRECEDCGERCHPDESGLCEDCARRLK